MQTHRFRLTQTKLASNLETTMSCQSFLPVSLHRAEAKGLALTPRSVDSPEQCEEHEDSLSMFCLDDLEPLCEQCAAVSHAEHRVYLLTEAATDCKNHYDANFLAGLQKHVIHGVVYKQGVYSLFSFPGQQLVVLSPSLARLLSHRGVAKFECQQPNEELRTSLNGLRRKMAEFEKVTQTCEHASRYNQAEAKLTEEHMRKEFESLHQFLREEEAARLHALREEQEEKRREAGEERDRLNQVIKSLEEKIQLVEEELDAGGDGVGFLEHYQDTMNSTGHREPQKARGPLIDVAKHLGNLQYAEWEKMKHIAPYTPLTLDPRTAGQFLKVSPGLNSVQIFPGRSQGLEQSPSVPANPERFHPYSCILGREGFDSGLHCWDIEVGDTNNWTVGVAAQSVSRRAEFEACPEAGLWCISLREDEYLALTTPAQTLNSHRLTRVRVRLDWDEGTLEFMNADTDTHLFMFRHRFTEKLHPYFESISSCGGFAVLAQRVKVSVGSDYDTEEEQVIKVESCTEGDINKALTQSNCTMSECERLTQDKNLLICSLGEEKKKEPQRSTTKNQLIKTKPAGKEKTNDNKPTVKAQSSKPRFSVAYHVSLNTAHQQ